MDKEKLIYLAGSCSKDQRAVMERIAKLLRDNGYNLYCPFELKIENAWDYSQEDWAQKVFDADLNALNRAELFLMITPGRNGTAGTNWEQGYMYANKKPIVVVQITDDETSLMTFCSAGSFYNAAMETLEDTILNAVENSSPRNKCQTILT